MKVITVLGTRPEIIRLCKVIELLDRHCEHVLVHTGQNYDYELNQVFFDQLGVRKPDHFLNVGGGSFGEAIGLIMSRGEKVLRQEKPDRFLVLGDTNSGLMAVIAKRLGIKVYHMEAGNRCYDDRVPEEVNRRVIDHSSDVLMPYTHNSKENLIAEGIPGRRIYVTGNPIFEVLETFKEDINKSEIHRELNVEKDGYFLVTAHREENVDKEERLKALLDSFSNLVKQYDKKCIVSVHPRTRKRLEDFGLDSESPDVILMKPLSFFDFVALEKDAFCVLSDSGTVQEECAIFQTPNVTLRDTTERPETLECGSNILASVWSDGIEKAVSQVLETGSDWQPPQEYVVANVSRIVSKIVLGYREF
jgi:UDP-N-acetylglucosamine 2-epimerase (non-hydrolysing)